VLVVARPASGYVFWWLSLQYDQNPRQLRRGGLQKGSTDSHSLLSCVIQAVTSTSVAKPAAVWGSMPEIGRIGNPVHFRFVLPPDIAGLVLRCRNQTDCVFGDVVELLDRLRHIDPITIQAGSGRNKVVIYWSRGPRGDMPGMPVRSSPAIFDDGGCTASLMRCDLHKWQASKWLRCKPRRRLSGLVPRKGGRMMSDFKGRGYRITLSPLNRAR